MRVAMQLTTLSLCMALAHSPAVFANTEEEIQKLRSEMAELKARNEQQTAVLRIMAAKIEALEAQAQPGTQSQPESVQEDGNNTRQQTAENVDAPASAEQPASESQGEETVVKEAPASRSTEAVYREQHALFDRKFTFEPGISYSHSDRRDLFLNGFLALDAIFLGEISLDRIKADTWTLDLTGRYSLSDRLQFDVNVPYLYRDSSFSTIGADNSTSAYAQDDVSNGDFGDVSFGAFYRLFREQGSRPDTVLSLRVKAPTGQDPYGIKFVEVSDSGGNLADGITHRQWRLVSHTWHQFY